MLRIFSKSKKLINWSNSSTDNSCSPSLSKNSNKKINYKINNIPEALNIQANFNNKNITVTIDTGANICCIRHSLVPKTQTLTLSDPGYTMVYLLFDLILLIGG